MRISCGSIGPVKTLNQAADYEWPAFHEAAHCVVAAAHFGHRINFVWIGKRAGKTNLDIYRASYGNERQYRLEEIIIYEAGRAAVDHLSGYKHEYADWEQSDDHKLSWPRAMWLSGDDEEAAQLLIQWAARRAECLVEKLWPQIHKLAFALLEQEKLSGEQIREVLSVDGVSAVR